MTIFRQNNFTGGENRKILPEFLGTDQMVLAQNCVMTAEGTVETRAGKVKVNATSLGSGNIVSIARFAKESGSKYLVAQYGTDLHAAAWDGLTPITSFGAPVKTGLSGAKLRYVVWKDNLICYSPTDAPFRYDGTTCTPLAGSPPNFAHLVLYGGRLWGIDAANRNLLRFSGLEDYDTWDALDLIKVRSGDGDQLTALIPVAGGMLVCKTRNVYPLYGSSRFDVAIGEAIAGIGCMGADTALNGICMAADNWYTTSLSGIQPLPETHTPILAGLTFAQKQAAFAAYQSAHRRAVFSLPTGVVIVFDGKNNAITSWVGLNATCFAVADAVGDDGALLIGGDSGHVYTLNGSDDDGAAIDTYIKTSYNDHGTGADKEWRVFWPKIDVMDSGNYEIALRYDVDYAAAMGQSAIVGGVPDYLDWGQDDWGQAYWGTGTNGLETPYWLHGVRGEFISFEIRTSQRVRLRGYESHFRVTGRKS